LITVNALAIDGTLPGMQESGASLGVTDENQRQLVTSSYLLGFGVKQSLFRPQVRSLRTSRPVVYKTACLPVCRDLTTAVFVPSFGMLLALRFTQGAETAATRVIAVAIVRDLFGGRHMAEIMSFVMTVFTIMPVIAPNAGTAHPAHGGLARDIHLHGRDRGVQYRLGVDSIAGNSATGEPATVYARLRCRRLHGCHDKQAVALGIRS
jgi:MFS family permease